MIGPKFCKDCAHCSRGLGGDLTEARCMHPTAVKLNFVTGVTSHYFCSIERGLGGKCGELGLNFAPAAVVATVE